MSQRGVLRVYLGAAPGVGKTYAMLDEGHRRVSRGSDVVVAIVETHGRTHTAAQLDGLEIVPRSVREHRGAVFEDLDLEAVLARRPAAALVDELAHTNVPGSLHDKRWQDVEALLDAGIDVITTVNVQHLESLNDVVQQITGVAQRETVPDGVVRAADQVELVDMTPEALRRRLAHGNVYAPEKIDAALGNYFRVGNLTALRELALLWLADSVDEGLQRYRAAHGIAQQWETRERIVVALTGGPEGETLIRRASRIAARATGGELLAVHVARSDGLTGQSPVALATQRVLVESLGGSYHALVGDDVPHALLGFARAHNATQIVLGASRRGTLSALSGHGTAATTIRLADQVDVHVVGHDYVGRGWRLPHLARGLTTRRRVQGVGIAVALLTALTVLGAAGRHDLTLGTDLLLYLLAVVVVSLVGGFWPAVAAAVAASLLLNYYFVPPLHRFTISEPQNVLALTVFVLIAVLVSRVVDLAALRSSQAARASAEADTLSTMAAALLRGENTLPELLERVRETFSVDSVALLHRDSTAPATSGTGGRGRWTVLAEAGSDACRRPEDSDTEVALEDGELSLALRGRTLPAEDQRVLTAVATQVGLAYRQAQLAAAAATAVPLAEADRMRTALLNAVSHDLRTPLATAKASLSGLADHTVTWSDEDRNELLATAGAALDRLTDLVTNLLDLSRLQAGVLSVFPRPLGLDDVVSQALQHVVGANGVTLDIPSSLREVLADAGLLERVVANLVQNAIRYSGGAAGVRVTGSIHGNRAQLRIIDRGPGIPDRDKERVFEPFQRRDDRATSDSPGVGLGLAIARGFTEAMAGELLIEDTPGGGVTMVVALPIAPRPEAREEEATP